MDRDLLQPRAKSRSAGVLRTVPEEDLSAGSSLHDPRHAGDGVQRLGRSAGQINASRGGLDAGVAPADLKRVHSYANITIVGPTTADIAARLGATHRITYIAPATRSQTVIFPSDLATLEPIALELSACFDAPTLAVMTYDQRVLLYNLYRAGKLVDAYMSEPHPDLADSDKIPAGDAQTLCDTFERNGAVRRVQTILEKAATGEHPYNYAANRHGDLCSALGLTQLAVGSDFGNIEIGELPAAKDFDAGLLVRTGSRP